MNQRSSRALDAVFDIDHVALSFQRWAADVWMGSVAVLAFHAAEPG
jgi:hypothetical protein